MTTSAPAKAISYLRVSSQRQGHSGLGLEAQRSAVAVFCRDNGCELLEEFQEVESGKKADRPILRQAIARAKNAKALLVIGKLDRLARNVAFIANLMESGCEFTAADMPHANRLTVHIMAAIAEDEGRRISQRTKEALAAAKIRGTLLGAANPRCRKLDRQASLKGAKRTASIAREANAAASVIVTGLRSADMSLSAIARELGDRGIPSRSGRPWSAVQVSRLLQRAA
jgi:DNA invertase Pin-like site-specific DNA recombinase